MNLLSLFREAVTNILSAKLRSVLAILGVLVGTASVVALISSSQLATAHALAQFKSLGTNLVSLYLHDDLDSNVPSNQTAQFHLSNVRKLQSASQQIAFVAPYTLGYKAIYFYGKKLSGQVIGTTETFAIIAKTQLAAGRFVSYLDKRNAFCVLGATLASHLQTKSPQLLGKQLQVGNTFFTVIGILKPWEPNLFISADINNSIIIPLQASYFLNQHVHIDNILIRLHHRSDISTVKSKVLHVLHALLPKKKVMFNSPEQLIHLVGKERQTYTDLLVAIGCISLVVGGIGVMNIMLVSVIERRREIGIRMAVGARQSDILRMFLVESILLTLFGGILGILVGVFTSYVFAIFSHWVFYFYLTPVILGFVVSVIVGVLSGFYPALRASRLNPIETLSY
jgi:putative ABC transport system permease protein